jgi:paraquat-inducible protein A
MKSISRSTTAKWLLVLSFALFVIGFFAPLITVKKFLFFTNRISLFSGLVQLLQEQHYGLFSIIVTFSVLLPLIKIGVLYSVCTRAVWASPKIRATLHWMALVGKWAMLDVFIVALLVVVTKVRGLADVEVHYGLYVFAASVMLLNLTAFRLDVLVQRLNSGHYE